MPEPLHPAIEFCCIHKRFGATSANADVSFSVAMNSVHGVVGENGAGKSTIMKILYGMIAPDEGSIRVRGEEAVIRSPQEAIRLGIGMVHQHFMLVPTMTVWQNIVLGHEGARFRLSRADAHQKLNEIQKRYGFALNLDAVVEELPLGHRQQVEILKLLYQNADILILDEPTAVLTPQEVETLFGRLEELRRNGKTIVIITHKLKEILAFTHRVTVMRQGRVVGTVATSELDESRLCEMIVGRKPASLPSKRASVQERPVLEVRSLTVRNLRGGKPVLDGIDLDVHAGEIVGIAGVEGNGQRELVECVSRVRRKYEGSILLEGSPLSAIPLYQARQSGLAVIPPDRQHEGLVLDFDVGENFILGHHREAKYRTGPVLSDDKIAPIVDGALETFDVRPRDRRLPIRALSGGNQQKVIIAREIGGPVKFLVAAHPTRGVDIGAIEFMHGEILKLRDAGAAVLLVSSELDEIFALSDRILVLFEGKIQGEVSRAGASQSELGLWMTGGKH